MEQFFGAYFHQDWVDEEASPDDVIRRYLDEGRTKTVLLRVANEIETFARTRDDVKLNTDLLMELGCNYNTKADGVSEREWLVHVVAMLREGCAKAPE